MFFWVVLGSLISLITWGKISENARSTEDHVVPVYESLVASMNVQNKIASNYVQTKMNEFKTTKAAVGSSMPTVPSDSGYLFKVNSAGKIDATSNAELAVGGTYYKTSYQYIKLMSGFKSAYFCVRRNATQDIVLKDDAYNALCDLDGTGASVVMVVTYGKLRGRYTSKSMHYFFKAVANAEPGAKNIGILRRMKYTEGVLSEVNDVNGTITDDDTILYRIFAAGIKPQEAIYLPKGIVANIKASEGIDNNGNLDGYFIIVELMKYKGSSCLIQWRPCFN